MSSQVDRWLYRLGQGKEEEEEEEGEGI